MTPARNLANLSMRIAGRGGPAIRARGVFFSTSQKFGLRRSTNSKEEELLPKQKKPLDHWEPELATASEEAVKADRAPPAPESKLQEETKEAAEETARAGGNVRDKFWEKTGVVS